MKPTTAKPIKPVLLLLAWLAILPVGAQPSHTIDSLKSRIEISGTDRVRIAFEIADNYMELNRYDSAQVWLNRIAGQVPWKRPDLSSYLLSTRQAEIYYYNHLHRLGLQEAERSRLIARALNDSVLLADSYNFTGLFYLNLDSFDKAIQSLRTGIEYARLPPYPAAYEELTQPHHLYGNLAEAYEKAGQAEHALQASRRSLNLAGLAGSRRGIVIAWQSMANAFYLQQQTDSAQHYYQRTFDSAQAWQQADVALLACAGLARTAEMNSSNTMALHWLNKGLELLASTTGINPYFASKFIDGALPMAMRVGSQKLIIRMQEIRNGLLQQQVAANNRQITTILDASLANETRLLQADIREQKQRNEIANFRVYLLLALLLLLAIGFLFYRHRSKQQLQLMQLQYKISQDLHDDVGSSLSSLRVYSTVAGSILDREPARAREMLQKITRESTNVMENIGDIVWSMKTATEQTLEERIRNFAADVLGAAGIHYSLVVEPEVETILRSFEARKNILLLIKEAVTNCVKFSQATHVSISIKRLAGQLCVQINDNGIGFQQTAHFEKNKGLFNMRQRTTELDGIFELSSHPGKGTSIAALIPLTKISEQR